MKKIFLALLFSAVFCSFGFFGTQDKPCANAADLYDMFTKEHIEFYEKEVAKRPVVSNLNKDFLAKTALQYNISVDKLKKVLVYQHAMSQCGGKYSIEEILSMQPTDLLRGVRSYMDWLKKNTPPEELEVIGQHFKEIGKKS